MSFLDQRRERRAALLAVDIAFDNWQQNDGKTPLGILISAAFDQLAHLDALS